MKIFPKNFNWINSIIALLFIFFYNYLFSQNAPENLNNKIYEFLKRLDTKHIINIKTETEPYSIDEIKNYLSIALNKKNFLTNIEKERLNFYLDYYGITRTSRRWDKFDYKENNFYFYITPVFGYDKRWNNGVESYGRVGGVRLLTSFGNRFSLYAHLQDRGDFKGYSDINRYNSPLRKYEFQPQKNGFEYSDVISGIKFTGDWFSLTFAKDYLRIGNGEFGQLILSDNVNSFPFIELDLNPVKWFRFRYLFASLNSKVIDSNYYYNSFPGSQINERRYDYINKYLVLNLFTFSPLNFVDFSLGNSFVYSGNLRMETFLPYSFFKYLDRDFGKGQIKDGNGQLFFDLSVRYPKNFKFYGTWFVDVISIRKSLEGNYVENWFAYTLGTKMYDPIIKNLDITFEYTKIGPWVYEHKDITTTYKHLNQTIGHWLGQNGDVLDLQFRYYILYNLQLVVLFESTRKGTEMDIYYAYDGRDLLRVNFLYPPIRRDKRIKFDILYEPIYSLILKASYEYINIKDDNISRTPKFKQGSFRRINIGFDYGFPY